MVEILSKLAEHGTLGVLLAIALWAIWKKDQELAKSHADRAEDAKANLAQTVRMAEACTVAITAQTLETKAFKTGLEELHETVKEYLDEARSYGHSRR